jgi:hypothetical protein
VDVVDRLSGDYLIIVDITGAAFLGYPGYFLRSALPQNCMETNFSFYNGRQRGKKVTETIQNPPALIFLYFLHRMTTVSNYQIGSGFDEIIG